MNHVVCKWDLRYTENIFELKSLTLLHTSKIVTEAYQVKRILFNPPSQWLGIFLYGEGTSYVCVYIVSFGQRYSLGRLPRVPVTTELTVCLAFEMPPQISTVRIPWLEPR